jgi:nucleoid-associated protein YgaU
MANILYRGSSYTTANAAGSKNAPLTNDEIDRNFYSLDLLKFDKVGGVVQGATTFSSNVTISGNLTVDGTTTTVNSTTITAGIYIAKQGDSFISLALRYLNNEHLYWYIADLNPQIKFPDLLPVGAQIRIPLT